ncbi:MAG: SURF1 family protein [Telluria sp.]
MTGAAAHREPVPPRALWLRVVAVAGALAAIVLFLALGTWQVQRLGWKRDLIARVDARVHAPPVPAPAAGARVTREAHEYLHVRADGVFLLDRTTYVQAVTDLGSGFWVMTPLCRPDGTTVLVNRGFVPLTTVIPAKAGTAGAQCRAGATPQAHITGLLRMTEPTGAFLRHNDPQQNRWYSRDVAAISAARGLPQSAGYFIDADYDPLAPKTDPVGGLTVIRFPNNHLSYALTWYAMALLTAGALYWTARASRQRPSPQP